VLQAALGRRATVNSIHAYDLLNGPEQVRGTTVLGVSHSGATETTNRALARARRNGARVLAMCGVGGSPMERVAHRSIILGTVHDQSWANTMSYTTQLTAFAFLAASVGIARSSSGASVRKVPALLRHALRCEEASRKVARQLAARERVTFLGTGLDEITALEAALKIRETCSLTASGYHTEQFLHGPFLSIAGGDSIVVLRSCDDGPRAAWILGGLRSAGAYLATFGDGKGVDVPTPSAPAWLRPIVSVVPMQFLAYYTALARKANPDIMRSDVRRYRAGLELLFTWRPRRGSSGPRSRPRRRS